MKQLSDENDSENNGLQPTIYSEDQIEVPNYISFGDVIGNGDDVFESVLWGRLDDFLEIILDETSTATFDTGFLQRASIKGLKQLVPGLPNRLGDIKFGVKFEQVDGQIVSNPIKFIVIPHGMRNVERCSAEIFKALSIAAGDYYLPPEA